MELNENTHNSARRAWHWIWITYFIAGHMTLSNDRLLSNVHDYGSAERNERAQDYSTIYYVNQIWRLIHLELYYWNSFFYEIMGLFTWIVVYLVMRFFYKRWLFPDKNKTLVKKTKLKF